MWRHQAGRIDFDGPLLRLWRRGWVFREYAPIVGARDDGRWTVVGIHGGAWVQGDHPERREAWAEAARLALETSPDMNAPAIPGSDVPPGPKREIDMSTREESEAERRETRQAYEDHKRRFVASGGDGRRFDGLHLAAAAVRRVERTLDNSGRERGAVERPATEHEIRQMLGDLAHEAGVARSTGRLREFRRGLWPYGPPRDI